MMKRPVAVIVFLFLARFLLAQSSSLPPLPVPVSNNAVATLKSHGDWVLYSLMGIGAEKTWNSVTSNAYISEAGLEKWYPIRSVPGTAGRIAAAAIGVHDRIYLFGGFVADPNGRGQAVPDVNIFDPGTEHWLRGTDLPIPVGDTVIGEYRDRYIYLIGGRSNQGDVANVQVYDIDKGRWLRGTPMPEPVFGHSGALVDDTIVYVDGAHVDLSGPRPRLMTSDECWIGKIDHHDPTRIEWSKLPAHPGAARYVIAAGGSEKDDKIYFSGGSAEPHGYSGMGYDGKPSEPSSMTFALDLRTSKWEVINPNTPHAVMDEHQLLVYPNALVLLGGMEKGQQVTGRALILPKQTPKPAPPPSPKEEKKPSPKQSKEPSKAK
jgi:Kelch motif